MVYSYGVVVNNNDVYVVGYIYFYMIYEVLYWKNGKMNVFFNVSGFLMIDVNDIKVVDNFVFVCGFEKIEYQFVKLKIWINDKEVFLKGDFKEGEVLGIYVVKK